MSSEYTILIHVDESTFADPAPGLAEATYARHDEFARRCALEGHELTGGSELRPARTARVVRPAAGPTGTLVTDGPFAELAEQVGGYYAVRTDDLDGLLRLIGEAFAGSPEVFEVRPVVPASEQTGERTAETPLEAAP